VQTLPQYNPLPVQQYEQYEGSNVSDAQVDEEDILLSSEEIAFDPNEALSFKANIAVLGAKYAEDVLHLP
jgi:hypothetical protein